MKSTIVFISLCAALFLSACGTDYYDRVIRNQSSKDVTYVHDGKNETLTAGESRTYSVTLAVHAPSSFEPVSGHPKSIVVETDGFTYTIEKAPEFKLTVHNNLSEKITISNEYISKGASDYATSFDIDANKTTSTSSSAITAFIYTRTPIFTVTPTNPDVSIPFVVEYKIEDDTMTVTISPKS
jgi:hypothetical protein